MIHVRYLHNKVYYLQKLQFIVRIEMVSQQNIMLLVN